MTARARYLRLVCSRVLQVALFGALALMVWWGVVRFIERLKSLG